MSAIYFVDTDEWINLSRHYPKEVFPGLWENIENLIAEGRILSPKEVLDEIARGHDELKEWCRAHRTMFLNTDNLIGRVQKILKEHPTLVNPNAKYESADPYLIALAASYKSNMFGRSPIIVTNENVDKTSRIPHAARANGVQTCRLMEMVKREGWKF